MAVQVAPAVKPVIVKFAGSASDAPVSSFATVPLVHVSPTVASAALFGTKSLATFTVASLRVFVIVQLTLPPLTSATVAHAAWLAA